MTFERFTDRSRKVMQLAHQEAQRFNHEYVDTGHILLGLVKEGGGVAANVLNNLDVGLRVIRLEIEKSNPAPNPLPPGPMVRMPYTSRTRIAFEAAVEEARDLGHTHVGTEHLLLGLLRDTESPAVAVLTGLGVTAANVREEVLSLLGLRTDESPAPKTCTCDEYRCSCHDAWAKFNDEADRPIDLTLADEYPGYKVPVAHVELALRVLRTIRNAALCPPNFDASTAVVLSEAHKIIVESAESYNRSLTATTPNPFLGNPHGVSPCSTGASCATPSPPSPRAGCPRTSSTASTSSPP